MVEGNGKIWVGCRVASSFIWGCQKSLVGFRVEVEFWEGCKKSWLAEMNLGALDSFD